MTWQILDSNYEQAKITVIGVGGGGGNSIQHMIKFIDDNGYIIINNFCFHA